MLTNIFPFLCKLFPYLFSFTYQHNLPALIPENKGVVINCCYRKSIVIYCYYSFLHGIRILSSRNGCGSFWSAVEGILHFFPRERDGVVRKLAVCSAVKNIEGSDARKRRGFRNLPVVGDEKGIEVADSRCRWFCLLYAVIRGAG